LDISVRFIIFQFTTSKSNEMIFICIFNSKSLVKCSRKSFFSLLTFFFETNQKRLFHRFFLFSSLKCIVSSSMLFKCIQ